MKKPAFVFAGKGLETGKKSVRSFFWEVAINILQNNNSEYGSSLDECALKFDLQGMEEAKRFFSIFADYKETPLLSLDGMAEHFGVGSVFYKDEGHRLGLQSFKALGGAYSVARLAMNHASDVLGQNVDFEELKKLAGEGFLKDFTVTCATDGNHGRSVAWGANLLGCRSVIFLHENVSQTREDAIARYGAEIVRVAGIFDDSVDEAARMAKENNWHLVSDTSSEPYNEAAAYVTQGYTVMVEEIAAALEREGQSITHVFVQAGVGGLASAVAGYFTMRLEKKPVFIVVEPEKANCLFQSVEAGNPMKVSHSTATNMCMLECYEPSHMGWPILARTAEYFMDVTDEDAQAAIELLANPKGDDPALYAGASGVAGLAGLMTAYSEGVLNKLGIDESSKILILGSEGAIESSSI